MSGVQTATLAGVLADFAERLVQGFRVQEILDHLVVRIVDVLPVTAAGVMLMGPSDELHFAAASNQTILEIETLQNELEEGPCLEAYRSGEAISIPDLGASERFPRFCGRAREAGMAAVFTFPMSINGRRFGALDLYRDQSGGLDDAAMDAAQVLANVAAAYLHYAHDRAEAADTLDLIRQQSLHDPLTGLPNRTLLDERLGQALARAKRSDKLVAVLFLDLDRFKAVNDEHGHHVGDLLLVAVADRITHLLRSGETVARLAGDEFVIVCEELERPQQAHVIATRVAAELAEEFDIEGTALRLSVSIGVATYGSGDTLPETLLREADFAMYQAKEAGGGGQRFVDQAVRTASQRRMGLTRDLHEALSDHDLQLAYQPIMNVSAGVVDGVEALLRWQHPTRGWVPPDAVVRVAESAGFISQLGDWVMSAACRDFQRWHEQYGDVVPHVTVNVSALQLMTPGFDETVQGVVTATGMDPANLFIEVTENVFLDDGPRALCVLREVKDIGVGIILDDFGTGYSSLSYLRRFPFDVLKIDRVFAMDVDVDVQTRTIVAAVIDLAHGLGLTVVAEGVETAEQLAALGDLRADRVQGYHLCAPLLVPEFEHALLETAAGRPIVLLPQDVPDPSMGTHAADLAPARQQVNLRSR